MADMILQRYKVVSKLGTTVAWATEEKMVLMIVPGCEQKEIEELCWLATGVKIGSNPGLHECVKKAFEFLYRGVTVEHDGQEEREVGIVQPESSGSTPS